MVYREAGSEDNMLRSNIIGRDGEREKEEEEEDFTLSTIYLSAGICQTGR
jgi:hypothetical protein